MIEFPRIKRLGEKSFLLEFEPDISPEVLEKVLILKRYLQNNLIESNVEVTSAYNSLLITYPVAIDNAYDSILHLLEGFSKAKISFKLESRIFHIPVCYDKNYALDLKEISTAKDLSENEIIRLHSSVNYLVYFIGFLPGFLYLGGLPEALHFFRRKHPRTKVEKGAVGIGEKQTGIYPQSSPGGWNIIGNSPVKLFDPTAEPPCDIKPGDRIRFYPVSLEEHEEIKEKVENGAFEIKFEEYAG